VKTKKTLQEDDVGSHCLLPELGWEQIDRLSKSPICGDVILAHIAQCPACRHARDNDIEAQLAAMDPERRFWIEELAARVAESC
jgi:hypothetical protein